MVSGWPYNPILVSESQVLGNYPNFEKMSSLLGAELGNGRVKAWIWREAFSKWSGTSLEGNPEEKGWEMERCLVDSANTSQANENPLWLKTDGVVSISYD